MTTRTPTRLLASGDRTEAARHNAVPGPEGREQARMRSGHRAKGRGHLRLHNQSPGRRHEAQAGTCYGVPPYRVQGSSLATGQSSSYIISTLFLTYLSLLPVCHSTLSTPESSSQRKGPQHEEDIVVGSRGDILTVKDFQQGSPILIAQRLKYGFKLNTRVYNNRAIQSNGKKLFNLPSSLTATSLDVHIYTGTVALLHGCRASNGNSVPH